MLVMRSTFVLPHVQDLHLITSNSIQVNVKNCRFHSRYNNGTKFVKKSKLWELCSIFSCSTPTNLGERCRHVLFVSVLQCCLWESLKLLNLAVQTFNHYLQKYFWLVNFRSVADTYFVPFMTGKWKMFDIH